MLRQLIALRGLRRGEAVGLRWCDIDLDNRVAYINWQIRHADGSLVLCPLKTADTYISVALELALSAAEAVTRPILRADRRPATARSAAPTPGPGPSSPPPDQQASTPRTPRNAAHRPLSSRPEDPGNAYRARQLGLRHAIRNPNK